MDTDKDDKLSTDDDVTPVVTNSVAIRRILEELKEEAANGGPNQYNRVYTRHMRS